MILVKIRLDVRAYFNVMETKHICGILNIHRVGIAAARVRLRRSGIDVAAVEPKEALPMFLLV